MADGTKIEWTDATINPIRAHRVVRAADGSVAETRPGWHCEHVSEACRNCYAEAINRDRFGTGLDYKPGHLTSGEVEIIFVEGPIREMLKWRRPRRIFVCSMTDLFADFVPDWMIDRVFAAAALAPQHTVQILTKRPERMREYLRDPSRPHRIAGELLAWADRWGMTGPQILVSLGRRAREEDPEHVPLPLPNVWLGVTAEDQPRADERIPVLLDTPAATRFVSVEPMLRAIDLMSSIGGTQWIGGQRGHAGRHRHDGRSGQIIHGVLHDIRDPRLNHHHCDERCGKGLDWVICGGESGPNARPMHPDWVRSLRDQCAAAGVPFLFKQWGEWAPGPGGKAGLDRIAVCPYGSAPFKISGGEMPRMFDMLDRSVMRRVGKRAAGRLLDGVTHDAFPEG